MDGVIKEVKDLWPGCKLVRGTARHSESNGGIERLRLSAETKIENWMNQTGSTHWSVGCKLVSWEMNTQVHRGIGGQMPYRMVFGQDPRVGLSGLAVDSALLESLKTEAEIVSTLNLKRDVPIEDQMLGGGTANDGGEEEFEDGTNIFNETNEDNDNDMDQKPAAKEDSDEMALKPPAKKPDDINDDRSTNTDNNADSASSPSVDEPFVPTSTEDLRACSNIRHVWLNLMGKTSIVTKDMLVNARINAKFPIVDRQDMTGTWRRVVLQKMRRDVWLLIDEMGAGEIGWVESTGDEGPIAEWGLYYKHPTVADFQAAREAVANKNAALTDEENKLNESPSRKKLRDEAAVALERQGRSMKAKAAKIGILTWVLLYKCH